MTRRAGRKRKAAAQDGDRGKRSFAVEPDDGGASAIERLPAETTVAVMSFLGAADMWRLAMTCHHLLDVYKAECQRCEAAFRAAHGRAWRDDLFAFSERNTVSALRSAEAKRDEVTQLVGELRDAFLESLNARCMVAFRRRSDDRLVFVVELFPQNRFVTIGVWSRELFPGFERFVELLEEGAMPSEFCPVRPSRVESCNVSVSLYFEEMNDVVSAALFLAAFCMAHQTAGGLVCKLDHV
eukprot:TRINITY_DN6092_c0_g1_i3.p1 TRINITY_DN6092_c0_g1~~TRINITY_DN6092_c0_g1_i3.p1  ORF type:complete len:240 (+),score=51.44 TRINITY_DN6092_c0_g1_i3:1215-1934(+)